MESSDFTESPADPEDVAISWWQHVRSFLGKLWTSFVAVLALLLVAFAYFALDWIQDPDFPRWVIHVAKHILETFFLFGIAAIVYTWWKPTFLKRWYERYTSKTELIIHVLVLAVFVFILIMGLRDFGRWILGR